MNARDRITEIVFDSEMQVRRNELRDLVEQIDNGLDISVGILLHFARLGRQAGIPDWAMDELLIEFDVDPGFLVN